MTRALAAKTRLRVAKSRISGSDVCLHSKALPPEALHSARISPEINNGKAAERNFRKKEQLLAELFCDDAINSGTYCLRLAIVMLCVTS